MADKIHLSIVTQDSTVFDANVSYVNIPTTFGSVGILSGHTPMLCSVERGKLTAKNEAGERVSVKVGTGVADVADNQVTLLVSDAETL